MWEYLVKKVAPRTMWPESSDVHELHSKPAAGEVTPARREGEHPLPAEGASGHQRVLKCPVCHVEMNIRYIGNVEIDQCPDCMGVFLDRGELRLLGLPELPRLAGEGDDEELILYTPKGKLHHLPGPKDTY